MLLLRAITQPLRQMSRHQDRGVHAGDVCRIGAVAALAVAGEQAPDDFVVEAEAAHQHVGGGDLEDLRRGQAGHQVGHFLGQAESEQRLGAILADQRLGQHQIGEVGVTDLVEQLVVFVVVVHGVFPFPFRPPFRAHRSHGAIVGGGPGP
jgi:hypothetical protein